MTKGTIIGILVVGILILAIPLTVRLAQQQQTLKSRAESVVGTCIKDAVVDTKTRCSGTQLCRYNLHNREDCSIYEGGNYDCKNVNGQCGFICTPHCPSTSDVACGQSLSNYADNCGKTCSGTGTKCTTGSTCVNNQCSGGSGGTSLGAPIVRTDDPTGIRGDGALLAATVNPNRAATDVWFRYGGGAGFENSTCLGLPASSTTKSIPTGPDDVKVYIPIYGMANGSKVFFCAVAKNSENSAGITYGDKRSFVTSSSGGGGSVPSSDLFLSISPNPVDSGQKVTLRGTAAAKCRAPYALSEGGGLISCAEPEVTFCSSGNPCEVKKVCTAGSPGTYTASFVETDCVSTSQSYTVNPSGSLCTSKPKGDANEDGKVDLLDFNIWRDEFIMEAGGSLTIRRADFNCSGKVDIVDFNIWLSGVNL